MHVDTEGWEVNVLKGANKILSNINNKMHIILECWDKNTSKNQYNEGRTNGILSLDPEKSIDNEIKKYNYKRLDDLYDLDNNIIFKLNY